MLRELTRVGQHRHRTHGVTHQDHRPARNNHLQNGFQIQTQLPDGVGLDRGLRGLSVPALVVEHHPDLITPALGQGGALKVKRSHPKTESMREHHGQWRGHRTDFADHQGGAVRRGDDTSPIGVE